MQAIITATALVGIIGLLMGLLLITVDKKFKVEVDEKEIAVREFLPGNNCGACGYAGCDAMASAIIHLEAPVNGCPVGGAAVAEKIAHIMGVEPEDAVKMVAFVKCSGDCENAASRAHYVGINDCSSAFASGLSPWTCDYGCLGFGTCASVCPFDAITVENGVARVDRNKCHACGKCVSACPKRLIEILPDTSKYAVRCSNHDRGAAVKKVCSAGCLACKLCEKQCEFDAIHVEDSVAHIDYEKCTGCGKCAEKCPVKVIKLRS
ncbi:MAG: RnfABCDGE type electron transport complex subunit B [Lachnospiraceae bacterium]|nr:RnfABCDGE type electron transport complex subunit B [Lachnospiraceae bacterium]